MLAPVLVSIATLLANPALAFFKLPCDNPLIQERADPIISPGQVAGHTHTVNGGSGFSLGSTYEDLRKSKCSSCNAKADLSAYWSPQLYIEWANGTFSSVPHLNGGGGLIYYLQRYHKDDKTKVLAFPEGFKMLAGDPFRRTYNEKNEVDQAIGWNCLGSPSPTRKPGLPTVNCPNGLRGEIRFPSCWDGVNLYKPDQSHVAYPKGGETGPCPSSHPKRLVTIFFEVFYDVDRFESERSKAKHPNSPFVLAQGDPTGHGYHGDFQNGWDVPVLQKAIDTCLSSTSGNIEECKVLELYDRAKDGYCRKTPDVNEVVLGNLPILPGCNPVTKTTEEAKKASSTCLNLSLPALFSKVSTYNGTVTPPGAQVVKGTPKVTLSYNDYKYLGCYEDKGPRLLSKSLNPKSQSVKACLDMAKKRGYMYAGSEFGGECWASNTKPVQNKRIGYDKCYMTCNDDGKTICGGPSALTVYRPASSTSKRHKRDAHYSLI
ncbi:hypothetical protein JCM16303_001811 [Sporobolomyces ruberrimus]